MEKRFRRLRVRMAFLSAIPTALVVWLISGMIQSYLPSTEPVAVWGAISAFLYICLTQGIRREEQKYAQPKPVYADSGKSA